MYENKSTILKTDKEIFEALIRGEKIKKLSSTNVKYVYLKDGYLIDDSGHLSSIYRLNSQDFYEIVTDLYKENTHE
jgi:hypothetical protein